MDGKLAAIDWTVIAVFMVGMVALGAFLAARMSGFREYFLAGGALSTPLLICTLVSTYFGLDVTFGTSEQAFYYGIVSWFWYSAPYYVFIAIAALVIARRLRRYDLATLPDLLDFHYGGAMRTAGAIACFIYSAPILSIAGLMTLLGWLGVPLLPGIAITIGVCGLYTALGGLWADTISDTVQFVLMCVTLALCVPLAIDWVGGWSFLESLPRRADGGTDFLTFAGGLGPWVLLSWAMAGSTVLVEPAFYQRVFAARDDRSITRALLLGIVLWASYDWLVVIIGLVARAAVEQGMIQADLVGKEALLEVAVQVLPIGLRGVMIGGIISAAMSSVDSYALLASGNLVYDILQRQLKRPLSDRALMWATRGGVVVVLAFSMAVGMAFDRMREAWQFMAAILGAVVLVPTLAALFVNPRRRTGLWGAIGGALGLVGYWLTVRSFGHEDPDHEEWMLSIATPLGRLDLWESSGVVMGIALSLIGMLAAGRIYRSDPPGPVTPPHGFAEAARRAREACDPAASREPHASAVQETES